jgi:hypothetical protein
VVAIYKRLKSSQRHLLDRYEFSHSLIKKVIHICPQYRQQEHFVMSTRFRQDAIFNVFAIQLQMSLVDFL